MLAALTGRLPRLGKWPRLALAACCLLLALDSAVTAHARSTSDGAESVPVVVAAHALAAGAQLRAADLRVVSWPRAAAAASYLHSRSDATGRRVITAVGVGEALSSTRLLGRDLAAGLTDDQVAVPVQLADPHAGDLLHAGDRVELYATARSNDGFDADPPADSTADVVATDLQVLAVLPAHDDAGVELIVAATRGVAAELTAASTSRTIAAVAEPP